MYRQLVREAHDQRMHAPAQEAPLVCVSAGAPCPADLVAEFQQLFAARLLDVYGASELSGSLTVNTPGGAVVPGPAGIRSRGCGCG